MRTLGINLLLVVCLCLALLSNEASLVAAKKARRVKRGSKGSRTNSNSNSNSEKIDVGKNFKSDMRKTANRLKEKKEKKCGKIVKAARAGDVQYLKPGGRNRARESRRALKINCHDEHGYTPLHHSARKNHPDFTRALIDLGADLELSTTSQKWTALHEAAYWGNVDIVDILIGAHANVEAKSHKGKTPLHAGCQGRYGNEGKVVQRLLQGGAVYDAADNQERTPLHDAAENNCISCAKHLLRAGANPESLNTDNKSPIDVADALKFVELATIMRDHSMPASEENEEASDAAETVSDKDDAEVVEL